MSRTFRGRLLVCAVAVMVVAASALSAGTALAAKGGNTTGGATKGGHHGGGTLPGTCSATPGGLGQLYTVNGAGFTPGEILNVTVANFGMDVLITTADSAGNFQVSSYASYTGTYTVGVYDNMGRTNTYITGCSFQVS